MIIRSVSSCSKTIAKSFKISLLPYFSTFSTSLSKVTLEQNSITNEKKLNDDNSSYLFDFIEQYTQVVLKYNEIFGNSWIRKNYIVDKLDHRWPDELKGYNLGEATLKLRDLLRYKRYKSFFMNSPQYKLLCNVNFSPFRYDEKVLTLMKCLDIYVDLYKNKIMPTNFTIPNQPNIIISNKLIPNPWPFISWGHVLGKKVKYYLSNYSKITSLIISKYPTIFDHKDLCISALAIYYKINSHFNLSSTFVIAENDSNYPKKLRGYKLGYQLNLLLSNNKVIKNYSKKSKFYKIIDQINQFQFNDKNFLPLNKIFKNKDKVKKSDVALQIAKAIRIYQSINSTNFIPISFVIPSTKEYPENMHGVSLGRIVYGIEKLKNYHKYVNIFKKEGVDIFNITSVKKLNEMINN